MLLGSICIEKNERKCNVNTTKNAIVWHKALYILVCGNIENTDRNKNKGEIFVKRFLAVFLTLCLVLTGLPMAFAAATPTVEKIDLSGASFAATSNNWGNGEASVADGNPSTFWNSASHGAGVTFSETLTISMDGVYVVDHFVFKVNSGWDSRTETVNITGSLNGFAYDIPIASGAELAFVKETGNTVELSLDAPVSVQYLKLEVTATTNSEGRGQIGEWEIYGYEDSAKRPVNKLALTTDMITVSGTKYGSQDNIVDGNQGTFWNGNGQTAVFTLDLQTYHVLNWFAFKLPSGWGDRTEVVNVLGSVDGETFTPLIEGEQTYNFKKTEQNIINVVLPKATGIRYFRLAFVSNDGDSNAQIGEIELYGYEDPNPPKIPEKLTLTADMITASNGATGDVHFDGDPTTYTDAESMMAIYTLNLKDVYVVDRFVLKLNPSWGDRTQTAYVQGSMDGVNFTNIFAEPQAFEFKKTASNIVTVELPENTSLQFFRLAFQSTTDSGKKTQIGELELYGYEDETVESAVNEIALTTDMVSVSGAAFGNKDNMVDNKGATYWEGNDNSFLVVDLQNTYDVSHFTVRVTNKSGWVTRTQTLVASGSLDGQNYTPLADVELRLEELKGEDSFVFDTPKHIRYLKLQWVKTVYDNGTVINPQVGELDIYGDPAAEKTVTVNFAGKNDVAIGAKTASSADALVALLNTVTAPALGGYKFAGWDNTADDLRAWYEGGFDTTLTVNAVYEVDTDTTYAVSATNAETTATGDLTFDSRVTVTATGDVTPTYWLLDGAKVGFGQKSYTFYVSGNNVIEPKFDAIDSIAEVTLQQAIASGNGETFNLSVIAQTSVVGKDVSEFGVIYAANPANLKDATKSIKVVSSKAAGQQYMTHLLNVQPGKYRYAVAYMVVGDEIIYSAKAVQFQTKADGTAAIVYKEGWNA